MGPLDEKGDLVQLANENAELRRALTKVKRLQKEAARSERIWSNLVKDFPEQILIVDRAGKMLYINRTRSGRTMKEILGSSVYEYLSPKEQTRIQGLLQKVFKTGKSVTYHVSVKRTDGREIWYENHVVPVRDKERIREAVILAADITKRRKAEIALQESEGNFRTLAEQSPNMIFIHQKGRLVYVNSRCEEIIGYSKEEFLSPEFDLKTIIAPEYHKAVSENLAKHDRGEEIAPKEYALLTKSGKRIEYILSTRLIPYKGENAILGVVTDITQRKRAEQELLQDFDLLEKKVNERTAELNEANLLMMNEIEERKRIETALRRNEEKLSGILESSPDAISMTDEKAVILECNQATLDLHGYSRKEEILGMEAYALIAPQDRSRAIQNLRRTIKYGVIMNVEYSFLKKDGTQIPAELSASVIKGKSGEIIGFVAVVKDISERKRAENALLASKSLLKMKTEELEQKNIALKEIVAQIEMEKRRMREDIKTNVSAVVSPILENLGRNAETKIYVGLLKYHLERLTSGFGTRITDKEIGLTPREIEICNMIKGGLSSKEIAQLLNISLTTVERHRKNIRKKLNITNQNVNLSGYLQGL
jgi:PAS domain S-box-containing protein